MLLDEQTLSWVITIIGMSGFILAGRKVWWSWYLNIACQIFWFMYALVSDTPAFLLAAMFYFVIFSVNAYKWTKEKFLLHMKSEQGLYRTKSVSVDARHFDGGTDSAENVINWLTQKGFTAWWKEPAKSYVNTDGRFIKEMPETIRILTDDRTLDLCPNEYAVLTTDEKLYISQACAFESTYERVT